MKWAYFKGALINESNIEDKWALACKILNSETIKVNLTGKDLSFSNLTDADISNKDLAFSNLKSANLLRVKMLATNLKGVNLTGACLEDCQVNHSTILDEVKCEHIFRKFDYSSFTFTQRLPVNPKNTFKENEFVQRFKILESALETIDLTFTEGINWKAFFQSFQELRHNHPGEGISIQAMERKGKAFVVRLEVETDEDKGVIETQIRQFYAQKNAELEAQYQRIFQLQSKEIAYYHQTQTSFLNIIQTMAENPLKINNYGQIGNFVMGDNHGSIKAYVNQNKEAINQLISALRTSAQVFPTAQKEDMLLVLKDLEADLKKSEEPDPKQIGTRLKRLIAAVTTVATLAGGAATFSSNINEFTENVFELGGKVGLSKDDIQITP